MPKLTSNDAPLNPYRVLWDLQHTVDINNTIVPMTPAARAISSRRSGSRSSRCPISAGARPPSSVMDWLGDGRQTRKTRQALHHVWGDAAIGFTGMDFEDRLCASGSRSCRSC